MGEVAARKSSKHNGRFLLKSRSPSSPYRLISHSVLLIITRSGFSESFLNSSNNRNVTPFRHLNQSMSVHKSRVREKITELKK